MRLILLLAILSTLAVVSFTAGAASCDAGENSTTSASRAYNVFTFGYLRMATSSVDSSSTLASFLAMVRHYNDNDLVPNVRFQLNVTTVLCGTLDGCRQLTPENEMIVQNFIHKMPYFTAVLKPNFLIAQRFVDEAANIGCVVINPDDMRLRSFTKGTSEHVVHFHQSWESQAEHLFTYMQQSARCAISAIAHDQSKVDGGDYYDFNIRAIQKLFTDGGFPSPPAMDVSAADDASFERFFMEDTPRRRCFIVLGTNGLMTETMRRLIRNSWYVPTNYRFYGFSTMASDTLRVNGSASHFGRTQFTHWVPAIDSPTFTEAYSAWRASPTPAELALFGSNETISPIVTLMGIQASMTIRLTMEVARMAIARARPEQLVENLSNRSVQPVPRAQYIDGFYSEGWQIDGHWFNHLIRECPRKPAPQVCYCNSLTGNSYIYSINTTTGIPYIVYDDESIGQRNVAAVMFPSTCGYEISSWSYPITGLAVFPSSLLQNNLRLTEAEENYLTLQSVFGAATYVNNYAPSPPTRALNYKSFEIDDGQDPTQRLHHYMDTLNPFIIFGSMTEPITDSRNILTLAPSFTKLEMEDPVLVPHSQWKWALLHLRPSQADYIHALCGYYHTNARRYTSLHAIAASEREAVLMSKSFATWGYDVPAATIVVSTHALEWTELIEAWLSDSSSAHPFILASTNANSDSEAQATAVAAARIGRGTVALAASMIAMDKAHLIVNYTSPMPTSAEQGTGDVVFPTFSREWWLPSVGDGLPDLLKVYVNKPVYHLAMLTIEVAKTLVTEVLFDFKTTAAEVLYKNSVIVAQNTVFGPFSNATCSEREIKMNARDRSCQCTKGIRTTRVLSLRNFVDKSESTLTNGYSWTMTTCGVVYKPYMPPLPQFQNNAALSSGAIAGVAVGGSVFVIAVIVGLVVVFCIGGRNNRNAPKDASKPFAIVFTDIQSSTSLWARAPAAMSEAIEQHHSLLRKCLRRNKGYEVKTVGDSFMVAFVNVDDAVRFSIDVQLALHLDDWNSEIDATYVELTMEAEEMGLNSKGQHVVADHEDNNKRTDQNPDDIPDRFTADAFSNDRSKSDVHTATSNINSPLGKQSSQFHPTFVLPAHVSPGGGTSYTQRSNNNTTDARSESVPGAVTSTNNGNVVTLMDHSFGDSGRIDGFLPPMPANAASANNNNDASSMSVPLSKVAVAPPSIQIDRVANNMSNPVSPLVKLLNDAAGGVVSFDVENISADRRWRRNASDANRSVSQERIEKSVNQSATTASQLHLVSIREAPHQVSRSKAEIEAWHGLRVRIGVHYGLGDIRKDPVSLGYDYYGTVVNTAARVEGVGHGGQILFTDGVNEALSPNLIDSVKGVVIALGKQPLRGLDEPIALYQLTPSALQARRFPPLRLHIEKETEDENSTLNGASASGDGGTNASETPEAVIARLCSSKQFQKVVSVNDLLDRFHFFTQLFSTASSKYKLSVVAKLGEAWGFEKASSAAYGTEGNRTRLLISMLGKVTKAYNVGGAHTNGNTKRRTRDDLSMDQSATMASTNVDDRDAATESINATNHFAAVSGRERKDSRTNTATGE